VGGIGERQNFLAHAVRCPGLPSLNIG
jgi:hypothetical protein